ncbi:MAG TPA: acetyl-CoA hydrolase/transferase C-terminal domain-containing protein [Aggregatilinea sp.]|jgi:acetyl-CoA hydrolase|uniref:acetyl-CoA hydrolase/transferase family protein n=1 Tax=Aggregatilinea sp. TaxID=2806333 RepID=UPI002C053431|nr:acetyl-CoA hydrolase/transferase C-terminal domain-containing protein [Aggregatilinea sp.]HML24403.1 acetyl-CoA hydrolase/transferase C-terminal domain-containing protein [Aggregatilinea sp.]
MGWLSLYEPKKVTAEEAVSVIKSGYRIFLTGNCSVPQHLMEALSLRAPELTGLKLIQVLTIGKADYAKPDLATHLRVNSLFISANVRSAINEGRADFTPVFLSEIPELFKSGRLPLDVALIQVSPPDRRGYCSYGVEVGVTKTAAESAKIVIAEVNPRMPRTLGNSFIHVSKIDYVVEVDYPLPEVVMAVSSEEQDAIANHLAAIIPDGATLQMGIGGIPDAVLKKLHNHKHLGVHTELFSDGVVDLVEAGVITNERKTFHPGKIIAGFVIGTQRLYDFVDDNPIVELHPTEYVNDPFNIAKNRKMVSINSAIEVDLTGQVCADSIGPSFYSGVGGQVDFVRGASRSEGGMPIIAMPSTAKGGSISRIMPTLTPGAGVTTSRNDVHYIATEYGVADLYGRTIRERAQQLVEIAHPKFRAELAEAAEKLYHVPQFFVPDLSVLE